MFLLSAGLKKNIFNYKDVCVLILGIFVSPGHHVHLATAPAHDVLPYYYDAECSGLLGGAVDFDPYGDCV